VSYRRSAVTTIFVCFAGLFCIGSLSCQAPSGSGSPASRSRAPEADDQAVTVAFNTPEVITLTANDPDIGPQALTYSIVSQPQHGTFTGTPPNVTYTPDTDYSGQDSFTFTANDGATVSDPATVSITIEAESGGFTVLTVNAPPVTGDIGVAGDIDWYQFEVTTQGTFTIQTSAGSLADTVLSLYGPDSPDLFIAYDDGFEGDASLLTLSLSPGTYYVSVEGFDIFSGTYSIQVTSAESGGANLPPTAFAQSVAVAFETPEAITLTASDPDSGPQALTYSIVSQPQHGTLTGTRPNVTYTPDAGYLGQDSFTFRANDGEAESSPATVSITVQSDETLTLDLGGGVTLELVRIPAGTFQMGDLSGAGYSGERPVHTVTISRPFYLGKYEVTQAQWNAVMGPTSFYFTGDNRPAEFVSWDDSQSFCQQVSALTARAARMPTEAEWEYACRAGTATDYSFGDDASQLGLYAWYSGNSANQTHDVGGKLPNAWGLYDMHGNVWESCQDWYGLYGSSAEVDPTGPASGTQRVVRGGYYGSTDDGANDLRCSVRNSSTPTMPRGADTGFRLAVDAQ